MALYISYKTYKRDIPKIEIDIANPKYECFFGNAVTDNMSDKLSEKGLRIAGVYLTIRNNSNADIQITSIQLKAKGEYFRRIGKREDFWHEIAFLSMDQDENKILPDWAYSINYSDTAIQIPCVLYSYTAVEGYCIFGEFPAKTKKKVKGTLVLNTAIGKVKKKVNLYVYDDTFGREDYEHVKQYYRSRGEN